MKIIEVLCIKIHTSLGRLVKGDIKEMSEAEIEKLISVRPDAIKVLGDAPKPVEKPKKVKTYANKSPKFN
jgi:hypothetical protein